MPEYVCKLDVVGNLLPIKDRNDGEEKLRLFISLRLFLQHIVNIQTKSIAKYVWKDFVDNFWTIKGRNVAKKNKKNKEERRVHLRCEHEYTKGARVHGLKWLLGLEICSHSLKKPAMSTWLKTQRTWPRLYISEGGPEFQTKSHDIVWKVSLYS
jgi:hypothetical protein